MEFLKGLKTVLESLNVINDRYRIQCEVKLKIIFCDSDRSKGSICSETESAERYRSHEDKRGRTEAKNWGIWNVSCWRAYTMLRVVLHLESMLRDVAASVKLIFLYPISCVCILNSFVTVPLLWELPHTKRSFFICSLLSN